MTNLNQLYVAFVKAFEIPFRL